MTDGRSAAASSGYAHKGIWLSDSVLLYRDVPYAVRVALVTTARPPQIVDVVAGGEDVAVYLAHPQVATEWADAFVTAAFTTVATGAERAYTEARGVRRHTFTVRYGGLDTDVDEVVRRLGCTLRDLIRLHTQTVYRVQSTGFSPGFAYAGPLPDALHLERKETPRLDVPAGAVAIAAAYTGIYPRRSAGGWWVIGQLSAQETDSLWAWENDPPARIQLGDELRFVDLDTAVGGGE